MSVSPPVQAPNSTDGDRQSTNSPYFPRISGPNTIARPSPMHTNADEAFPTVKLQAKMVKQTPLPYQTQEFKPCIVLKRFEPTVRVSDSFMPGAQNDDGLLGDFKKKRTVILHTDRYTSHGQLKLEADSQKVRLAQEGQMLQDARSRMRLREALAHRARHDLHLGGNPIASEACSELDDEYRSVGAKHLKKDKRRQRRLKKPTGAHRQQLDERLRMGFIPEDAADNGEGRRLGSHASSVSAPLHLPSQHRAGQGQRQLLLQQTASFVSRSELDALTALIGGNGDPSAEPLAGGAFGCGLEKVKLDGSKAVFNRRSDILEELSRLKAIVLPDFAKDLYVGRGIRLPGNHGLNNPKRTLNVDDPILQALLNQAQQPARIVDESGNILVSAGEGNGAPQQQQQRSRQVFVADVTAQPKKSAEEPPVQPQQQPETIETSKATDEAQPQQQQQKQKQLQPEEQQLPEPFLGLSSGWGMRVEAADDSVHGDAAELLIKQLQLSPSVTAYLLAILAASGHARAGALTLELGRLIGQRALGSTAVGVAGGGGELSSGHLIGWLRRGLDLFHDVDRECKGSVSLAAFFDILSSMRDLPVGEAEAADIRAQFGLSGDSVSKFAFLTVLPFLLEFLSRQA